MEVYGKDADGNDLKDRVEFTTAVKSSFERNKEDRFNVEVEDVGEPYKIRVGHDNKGFGAAWHLDKVVMIHQTSAKSYEFPCGEWLSKVCTRQLRLCAYLNAIAEQVRWSHRSRPLVLTEPWHGPSRHAASGPWHIQAPRHWLHQVQGTRRLPRNWILTKMCQVNVITGDIKGSGTDANVYIQAFGEHGDWGERKMAKSKTYRDKFERNHTDEFEVEAVSLGQLEKVHVWHDNKGLFASWYLERIEIEVFTYDVELLVLLGSH